jgi:hypothetical protein
MYIAKRRRSVEARFEFAHGRLDAAPAHGDP